MVVKHEKHTQTRHTHAHYSFTYVALTLSISRLWLFLQPVYLYYGILFRQWWLCPFYLETYAVLHIFNLNIYSLITYTSHQTLQIHLCIFQPIHNEGNREREKKQMIDFFYPWYKWSLSKRDFSWVLNFRCMFYRCISSDFNHKQPTNFRYYWHKNSNFFSWCFHTLIKLRYLFIKD